MKQASIGAAEEIIRRGGIIAIARGSFEPERLAELAAVLRDAGYTALEVTLNSDDALGHIGRLADRVGDDMLVGAGTVLSERQAEEAVAAGARFLVAPGYDAATVAWARKAGILHLPGVMTPTEVQTAAADGCSMVKLFPSEALGTAYLKALRAPFHDMGFVPTGGISAANAGTWRAAGAVAVGAGSTLIRPGITAADLKPLAKALRQAWNGDTHER